MIERPYGSAAFFSEQILHKKAFGTDFKWGVSTAAYQVEGAHQADGKGPSIWDVFSNKKGNTYLNQHGNTACNFYHCYPDDLQLMQALHIPNFRFSIAWSRVMPAGVHPVNQKGIDYYQYLIDHCLELGIEPWVTLYHWDLPHALERKGGWTNRDIVGWFSDYAAVCIKHFGDRVKYWMILNEPMVFTGAGHFLGIHAPGRRWMKNFIPAVHHATLCQAAGARILKDLQPQAQVGTTFSASYIEPQRNTGKDRNAALRIDALLNRLFLEPALGLGYPVKDLPFLQRIEKYLKPGDEKLLPFDFDFVGLQVYTREIVSHTWLMPFIQADLVKATKRDVPTTLMNWEVYPESIYQMLKKYHQYGLKKIIVTENGAAFTDVVQEGQVHDPQRLSYLQNHIGQMLRAKQEGVPVEGYFVWTFTDNFEWAMGYHPRFGLVYVDFETQQRIVKSSGYWYRDFLRD
jgi:beta-glucosidase